MSHLHAGAVSRPARPYHDDEDYPLLEPAACLAWMDAAFWVIAAAAVAVIVWGWTR